mgnify:CR=1 FL=1
MSFKMWKDKVWKASTRIDLSQSLLQQADEWKAEHEHPLWTRDAGGSSSPDALHGGKPILHRSEYGISPHHLD